MSLYLHKSHNVSVLLYHIVCPAKYRKAVFTPEVKRELKGVCDEIEQRYEIMFLEIGADVNHVHFLVQSVPMYSPTKIVRMVKRLTARALFARLPRLRKALWGGELWSSGFFISSVGKHGSETAISRYVREQGGGMYRRLDGGGVQEGLFAD
jgi:REP element-mobilizing transposase RayT